MQSDALTQFVIDKIDDMKGRDIITIDVKEKSSFTDFMAVCSGNSNKHVQSIAKHIALEAKSNDSEPLGIEGLDVGEWCLIDLGSVVVHVMTDASRDLYELEKLWGDI